MSGKTVLKKNTTVSIIVRRAATEQDLLQPGAVFFVPINGGHAVASDYDVQIIIGRPHEYRFKVQNDWHTFKTLENVFLQ